MSEDKKEFADECEQVVRETTDKSGAERFADECEQVFREGTLVL